MLWNKIGRAGPHGVFVQTATVEAVQREVEALLSRADPQDLNPWLGQLACSLVSRSSTDPPFYPASGLAALVRTGSLCHRSVPRLQDRDKTEDLTNVYRKRK